MSIAAIILAGGRSRRMGAPKHALRLGGRTLLGRALDAVDRFPTVVVGPRAQEAALVGHPVATLTRERPAFSGPVAAIAAGVDELTRRGAAGGDVLLLSCDLARPVEAVELLLDWRGVDGDGVALRDGDARMQWLCGLYRLPSMRTAVERMRNTAGLDGARVSALFDGLSVRAIADPDGLSFDIDTPADLVAATRRAAG